MTGAPFRDAMRAYLRIMLLLLAAAGLGSVVALQTGALVTADSVEKAPPPATPEAGQTLVVTGETNLLSQLIPVDPALTYTLSARLRAPRDGDELASTQIYLGVEAFDADRKPLRTKNSAYRYTGARSYRLRPVQGWVTLEGEIAGEGDDEYHQFMPGTRYVRIVLRLNRRSEGRTTELDEVRFEPRLEMRQR